MTTLSKTALGLLVAVLALPMIARLAQGAIPLLLSLLAVLAMLRLASRRRF